MDTLEKELLLEELHEALSALDDLKRTRQKFESMQELTFPQKCLLNSTVSLIEKYREDITTLEEELSRCDQSATEKTRKPQLGIPSFHRGNRVRVHYRDESDDQRPHVIEGVVVRINRCGLPSSFTVRKASLGVGTEMTFPFHSPAVSRIELVSRTSKRRYRRIKLFSRRNLKVTTKLDEVSKE